MAKQHNALELASQVWHKMSFEGLCKLEEDVLKNILRLVDQDDERATPAGEGVVPTSKSSIRDKKIQALMEKSSNEDIWLTMPALENLTGYKKNTLYLMIPKLGVTVKRHNVSNAKLISAQSFCRAYFNISSKNGQNSTITQDILDVGSDKNYQNDLRLRDLVFQFHP